MTQNPMTAYPEHAKQEKVVDQSQVIGEFLDTSGCILAEYRTVDGFREPQLVPVNKSIEQVLAEYLEIDLDKIEAEKRAMLESIHATDS